MKERIRDLAIGCVIGLVLGYALASRISHRYSVQHLSDGTLMKVDALTGRCWLGPGDGWEEIKR